MRLLPAALALLAASAVAAQPAREDLLDAYQRQLKAVHAKAGPAMACVVVSRSDQYPKPAAPPDYPGRLGGFDPEAFRKAHPDRAALARQLDLADPRGLPDHPSAAGVVLDPAGLVLTNFHVVEGATKVYVHLPGGKGSYADVHAADARSDLAVLKLITPPAGLKAVTLGDARPQQTAAGPANTTPGTLVAVLAFQPTGEFALLRPGGVPTSLTNVQFPREPNQNESIQSVYRYAPLLEYEARSTPPVSGAAVLSLDGELVGLTSTVAAVSGGDNGRLYALPVDASFRRIVGVLARGEEVEYGFVGIVLNRLMPGIVVDHVAPRSPADGRLFPGDRIVRINGTPARTYPDLLYLAGSGLAGNRATLTVVGAGGKERPVELTLAKYKHDQAVIAANRPAPVFGLRVDWSSVLAQGAGASLTVPSGVAVRELVPGSPAAEKFKDLGENGRWLISAVDGTPTPTPAAFYQAARNKDSVRLTVTDLAARPAQPREVTLP